MNSSQKHPSGSELESNYLKTYSKTLHIVYNFKLSRVITVCFLYTPKGTQLVKRIENWFLLLSCHHVLLECTSKYTNSGIKLFLYYFLRLPYCLTISGNSIIYSNIKVLPWLNLHNEKMRQQ